MHAVFCSSVELQAKEIRCHCAGSVLTFTSSAPVPPDHWRWEWLRKTTLQFSIVQFHPDDQASSQLLLDNGILVRTETGHTQRQAGAVLALRWKSFWKQRLVCVNG